jgi:hypothetical protein
MHGELTLVDPGKMLNRKGQDMKYFSFFFWGGGG